jgi:hypothetical protein
VGFRHVKARQGKRGVRHGFCLCPFLLSIFHLVQVLMHHFVMATSKIEGGIIISRRNATTNN